MESSSQGSNWAATVVALGTLVIAVTAVITAYYQGYFPAIEGIFGNHHAKPSQADFLNPGQARIVGTTRGGIGRSAEVLQLFGCSSGNEQISCYLIYSNSLIGPDQIPVESVFNESDVYLLDGARTPYPFIKAQWVNGNGINVSSIYMTSNELTWVLLTFGSQSNGPGHDFGQVGIQFRGYPLLLDSDQVLH